MPATLYVLITVFFFSTFVKTWNTKAPIWKSSSLALLYSSDPQNGRMSRKDAEKTAKVTSMKLDNTGTTWHLRDATRTPSIRTFPHSSSPWVIPARSTSFSHLAKSLHYVCQYLSIWSIATFDPSVVVTVDMRSMRKHVIYWREDQTKELGLYTRVHSKVVTGGSRDVHVKHVRRVRVTKDHVIHVTWQERDSSGSFSVLEVFGLINILSAILIFYGLETDFTQA